MSTRKYSPRPAKCLSGPRPPCDRNTHWERILKSGQRCCVPLNKMALALKAAKGTGRTQEVFARFAGTGRPRRVICKSPGRPRPPNCRAAGMGTRNLKDGSQCCQKLSPIARQLQAAKGQSRQTIADIFARRGRGGGATRQYMSPRSRGGRVGGYAAMRDEEEF